MNLIEQIDQRIRRALRAIRLPFRARLTSLNGAPGVQLAQAEGLSGEQLQAAEVLQHFGFTSGIPGGAQLVALPLAGKTDAVIIIGSEHTAHRIHVKGGETCVYSAHGSKITLKEGNLVEVDCKDYVLKARTARFEVADSITMQSTTLDATASASMGLASPALGFQGTGSGGCKATMIADFTQIGSQSVTGDVTAGGISQTGHTHSCPHGGNTGAPQ